MTLKQPNHTTHDSHTGQLYKFISSITRIPPKKHGVALTGRNRTGRAVQCRPPDPPRAWRPASPTASSVTDNDRRRQIKQNSKWASKTILAY